MNKTITVFTPTYNRADLLHRGYESLKRQSVKDFVWMIIDDGSTDRTREVVEEWQRRENGFEILYKYKENGGLQSGYVEAVKYLTTELAVCMDSDDYLTDDAIESIVSHWKQYGGEQYAGVLAFDRDESGKVFGEFYEDRTTVNLIDLETGKLKRKKWDRVLAIRSDLYRRAKAIPTFPGELSINAIFIHLQISLEYDFLILNKATCVVEYQADGLSKTKMKQYVDRPNNFAEYRLLILSFKGAPPLFYVRQNIHYVSSCLFASRKHVIRDSPTKLLTLLCYPLGMLLCLYIKYKIGKMR